MTPAKSGKKQIRVGSLGFIQYFEDWTEDSKKIAAEIGISGELTQEHWKVIRYLRKRFAETENTPTVYQACRQTRITMADMERLFPAGYQRGACRIAGLPYLDSRDFRSNPKDSTMGLSAKAAQKAFYRVDVHGFLVDPNEWDEQFAHNRAAELGVKDGLGDKHWKIIKFLRKQYVAKQAVPTVFKTCRANGLQLNEMEKLFPSGYHRGVVKIAGLRIEAPLA